MTIAHSALAFGAGFAAGMINAVAGGGTLVSFPTLIWLRLSPVVANATSTVAIWPAALGGMVGYRRELRDVERKLLALAVPSVAGGIAGALLLRWTPPAVFAALVPYLILFATILFAVQEPVQRRLRPEGHPQHRSAAWLTGAMIFQLFVAIYGGYFGAGIGILMLAALGVLGMTDIHQMNGLKNFFGMTINGVAALYFIWAGMVYWPDVLVMAAGAIAGGYGGAGFARRIGRSAVRKVVILIGFSMALSLFLKR
jgi:uncharacterized membrane protein YfcA